MYGPAVQCKRLWSTLADAVLRQCIRSPIGACAPAITDTSAHAISLAVRPRRAIWVTRVRTRRIKLIYKLLREEEARHANAKDGKRSSFKMMFDYLKEQGRVYDEFVLTL
jgi:hypothetical protein